MEVVSDYSGTCLDVGSTKQSGSPVSLTVCQNLAQQLLVLRGTGTSYSMFGLELQPCSDAAAQTFEVQGGTGAYSFASSVGRVVCLDDAAFGASIGTRVAVYACNSSVNQKWTLVQ